MSGLEYKPIFASKHHHPANAGPANIILIKRSKQLSKDKLLLLTPNNMLVTHAFHFLTSGINLGRVFDISFQLLFIN